MSLAQTNDDGGGGGGGEDSENLYKSPIAVARFDRAEDGRGNDTTSRRSDGRSICAPRSVGRESGLNRVEEGVGHEQERRERENPFLLR